MWSKRFGKFGFNPPPKYPTKTFLPVNPVLSARTPRLRGDAAMTGGVPRGGGPKGGATSREAAGAPSRSLSMVIFILTFIILNINHTNNIHSFIILISGARARERTNGLAESRCAAERTRARGSEGETEGEQTSWSSQTPR